MFEAPAPFRIAIALSIPLALAGCDAFDADTPETGEADRAIVGGQLNTGDPAVAFLSTGTTAGGGACSGTLISPRVLLTAAHCIDLGGAVTSQSVYFGTTSGASDPGEIETIEGVDRTFISNWNLSAGDVAMVLLRRESNVTPIGINRTPLNNNDVGRTIRLVGWGDTDGDAGDAGDKRQVTSSISGLQNQFVFNYGSFSSNTCQGDSGGPSFINQNGTEVVAGITSWGTGGCRGTSGAMRVAQYANFIDNWVEDNDVRLPPDATFIRPLDGERVAGFFVVEVDATDNVEIDRVEIYLDGSLDATLELAPYIHNLDGIPDGQHTLEVRAYDNFGDSDIETIAVNVDSSCQGVGDCPAGTTCEAGTCIPSEGRVGDTCADNTQCASGLCAESRDGRFCTERCDLTAAEECPESFECTDIGDGGICAPSSSGGCNAAGSRGGTGALALALFALFGLARRRRTMAT